MNNFQIQTVLDVCFRQDKEKVQIEVQNKKYLEKMEKVSFENLFKNNVLGDFIANTKEK